MVTPHENQPELAKSIVLPSLFFKREDLHPYGSHKGRSIPVMIDTYVSGGFRHFAVSSSGNSALAAGLHVHRLNQNKTDQQKITIEIFVGKNIKPHKLEKLEKLKDSNILISIQERPVQTLFIKTQDPSIKGLRQSTDDTALIGYNALAEELLEIPDLKAVFVGSSSGTTAQALADYFIKHSKEIEVHVVQTSSCHPLADSFIDTPITDEKSIADAIVDHVAVRKASLVPKIEKTGGSGWVAQNEQITNAQHLAQEHAQVSLSPNGALPLVGVMEASYTGKEWEGSVVCLIGGE